MTMVLATIYQLTRTTKIIIQKLLDNTNCMFEMNSLKTVTELFGRRQFKINDEKGISLSLQNYQIRHKLSASKLITKAENICKQVTKLQIERNKKSSKDIIDLFPNLIDLEICHTALFDSNPDDDSIFDSTRLEQCSRG